MCSIRVKSVSHIVFQTFYLRAKCFHQHIPEDPHLSYYFIPEHPTEPAFHAIRAFHTLHMDYFLYCVFVWNARLDFE